MTLLPLRASEHLHEVKYEIRGALARRAEQLEREGHDVIKLNIGNLGAFGFRMPPSMRVARMGLSRVRELLAPLRFRSGATMVTSPMLDSSRARATIPRAR